MTVSKLTKDQIEILSNYSQVARTTDTTATASDHEIGKFRKCAA